MNKGATRNYNTKPNKSLHGPLKVLYKDCTNYKEVAEQVSRRFYDSMGHYEAHTQILDFEGKPLSPPFKYHSLEHRQD